MFEGSGAACERHDSVPNTADSLFDSVAAADDSGLPYWSYWPYYLAGLAV